MDPLKIYLRLLAFEMRVAEIGVNLGHLRDGLRTIDTELLMLMSDLEKQILEEEGEQHAETNRRGTHRQDLA